MKALLPFACLAGLLSGCSFGASETDCDVSYTPTEQTSIEGTVTMNWKEGKQDFAINGSFDGEVDIEGGVPARWEKPVDDDDGDPQPAGWKEARIVVVRFPLAAGSLSKATLEWCNDPYGTLVEGSWCHGATSEAAVVERLAGTIEETRAENGVVTYTIHGVAPSGAIIDLVVRRETVQMPSYSGYDC